MMKESHNDGLNFVRATLLGGWQYTRLVVRGLVMSRSYVRTSNNEYGKKNTVNAIKYCLSVMWRSSVIWYSYKCTISVSGKQY